MTPERIAEIIRQECFIRIRPKKENITVAANKIHEEIIAHYYYSPYLAVLYRNREKCLHWEVVGSFCGKPSSATTHLMCENCSKLVTDIISLSQPSLAQDVSGVGHQQRGDAGELKTDEDKSSLRAEPSPKDAPERAYKTTFCNYYNVGTKMHSMCKNRRNRCGCSCHKEVHE